MGRRSDVMICVHVNKRNLLCKILCNPNIPDIPRVRVVDAKQTGPSPVLYCVYTWYASGPTYRAARVGTVCIGSTRFALKVNLGSIPHGTQYVCVPHPLVRYSEYAAAPAEAVPVYRVPRWSSGLLPGKSVLIGRDQGHEIPTLFPCLSLSPSPSPPSLPPSPSFLLSFLPPSLPHSVTHSLTLFLTPLILPVLVIFGRILFTISLLMIGRKIFK